MPDERLLRSYLDDHAAIATAADSLIGRMLASPAHASRRELLEGAREEVRDDRDRLAELLAGVGSRPSRAKGMAMALGERVGRLKPNGRLTSSTPLTPVVELEGLGLVLSAQRAAWRALERAGGEAAADHGRRAARMEARAGAVEEARLDCAAAALAPEG